MLKNQGIYWEMVNRAGYNVAWRMGRSVYLPCRKLPSPKNVDYEIFILVCVVGKLNRNLLSTKHLEERELLRLIEDGNPKTLEQLCLIFFGQLSYYAFKIVNDPEAAKNIAAGVLAEAAGKPERFENLAHLKNHLFLATRHASLHWEAQFKKEQFSLNELHLVGDDYDWLSDLEQVRARVVTAVHEQINLLPKGCTEVFTMIYFEGKSTEEVARILRITIKTALNQKLAAVRLLRTALLKQGLMALFILFWGEL